MAGATRKIYEVKVHVTEITEEWEEGQGYSKTTHPATVSEKATVSLKGDSAEKVLTQLTTIIPTL